MDKHKGLHIVVPSNDGHLYVIDGITGSCFTRAAAPCKPLLTSPLMLSGSTLAFHRPRGLLVKYKMGTVIAPIPFRRLSLHALMLLQGALTLLMWERCPMLPSWQMTWTTMGRWTWCYPP